MALTKAFAIEIDVLFGHAFCGTDQGRSDFQHTR